MVPPQIMLRLRELNVSLVKVASWKTVTTTVIVCPASVFPTWGIVFALTFVRRIARMDGPVSK
tara:strand:+ start:262 stop:450 length:189 start_codon:yes stop_codon:yes gene_type:complete